MVQPRAFNALSDIWLLVPNLGSVPNLKPPMIVFGGDGVGITVLLLGKLVEIVIVIKLGIIVCYWTVSIRWNLSS